MQSRQPAPGGGIDGFTSIPSPHDEPSRDHPRHKTVDFTRGFDPKFTTHSDSNPPHFETAGISEGMHAGVWPTYNKVSQEFDEKRLKKWNEDLDVLLIFVSLVVMGDQSSSILTRPAHDPQSSLFSAIVASFLIRSLDDVRPDYQQQTALLLHQLLNGRDPNLAIISNPTIPMRPAGLAIAVNCLWCASLTISVGASAYAMTCKWWLTEYSGGANPVGGLLRACRRHMRFMAFEKLSVHALVAFLSTLIFYSINLFLAGGIMYLVQINWIVMVLMAITGGTFFVAYFFLFIFPSVTNLSLFRYSTFIFYRPSSSIGKAFIFIVDVFLRTCRFTLRWAAGVCMFPFIQTVSGTGTLHHWYIRTQTVSPREHDHTPVQRAVEPHGNPSNDIDTSRKAQEEAILWLSQVPLNPSESKALVSSLALLSPSRPYGGLQRPVVVLTNLVLEASFREEVGEEQSNTAIDCVLVLGNIKFQAAVDQHSDCDHNVGGIHIPPSVAWVAQQLTIDALQAKSNAPHSGGILARLLTATGWLSPVEGAEDVSWDGRELKIQSRSQFIEEIRTMLERHIRNDAPLDSKILLINLIHGMHASIPRGNYGSPSSIAPFLSIFCENHDSPWSDDEAVLRALITYALDLLLPPERRKPLVSQRIEFDDLASELIGALIINTDHPDAAAFAFWLASRIPYAFRSRKTMLTDIAYIWLQTNESILEDQRKRSNFHAADAFIAAAQHHVSGGLSGLTDYTALKLLSAALENGYSRPTTIYTMAMILNLVTTDQLSTVAGGIEAESVIDALFSGRDDLEGGTMEEDVADLQIYSALTLLKLLPTVELDVERVKGLIVRTEEAIGEPSVVDPGTAKRVTKSSEAGVDVDLDRARWKAIYLSVLLFKFLPGDEREKHVEGLWTRVRTLLRSEELSFMGDCGRCLEPLGIDMPELTVFATDHQGQINTVFEGWIDGFPLFQLVGAVSEPPPGQRHNRPSFINPRRWFR